jgi:transposase
MKEKRQIFDRNFKLKAVELSYERDNIKELAHELGIRVELLYRWRAEFATRPQTSFPGNGKVNRSAEETEILRLQKELAEMRMERDILKKAISIFSKNDGKSFNS